MSCYARCTGSNIGRRRRSHLPVRDRQHVAKQLRGLGTSADRTGKYGALVWDDGKQSWEADPGLQVRVNVEDLSSAQVVVNTKGPHTGTFTFSSHEAADHQICLSTEGVGSGHKHVKMYLDVNVGPSKHDKE